MTGVELRPIAEASFRANPDYELVLFDRLDPEQRELLRDLERDPELYGILVPRAGSGLGTKAVSRETALLYLTLQVPGRLPSYLRGVYGDDFDQAVAHLVLDGVLEVEGVDGFVHGAEAYDRVYAEAPAPTADGAVGRLSLEALRFAQALELTEPLRLSARLYFFNRRPLTPELARRFATRGAVADFLGVSEGRLESGFAAAWERVPLPPENDGWLLWRSRRAAAGDPDAADHKLYVSPTLESVSEAFRVVLDVAAELDVPALKVGNDVYGLLRPDKIVLYVLGREHVDEVASELARRLDGVEAQGVPFTAELAGNGLLSWGIDPPRTEQVFSWQERESWRLWVTNRLATALVAARGARGSTLEPWQYALERLRLEGVDTATWTPGPGLWAARPEEAAT